ncbi:MAG: hypothetical protein QG553_234 [Patescibacteria group bacterium]|nr:hypothetical protein [Patescibacteria group bacterium]
MSSDELIIERHQRSLSEEELSNGRPIVLLGLGNSTIAMLRQIHEFEDRTLQTVPYVVVTHHSRQAVKNPTRSVDGDRPLFRNPAKSYLTGISGDIDRDAQTYSRMLAQELVVTDARTLIYDEADHTLNIGGTRINIKLQQPHLFALIGYQRDGRLFNEIDALIGKKSGEPAIRPCDGAVATLNEGYLSNVFAIGAVAASRRNPNAAVIPGIMAQVPGTVATIACRHIIGV